MKQLNHCLLALLAALLAGCSATHTADPTAVPAWSQIQPGMTRQQVYAALGKPLRETEQEAEWKSPEAKMGWPSTTYWRKLEVYFDEKGQVRATRDYEQQK
ncbi:MAG: outer membrane protein assembly factor BamE [Verrucomicrobiota bacterium]|jgi:outer membrane protein assembly factor BamE (lipoprotein component of BamABCDE complex)